MAGTSRSSPIATAIVPIYRQIADGSGAAERLTKPEEAANTSRNRGVLTAKCSSMNMVVAGNQGVWTTSGLAPVQHREVFVGY